MERILSYKENLPSIQEREEFTVYVHFFVGGLATLYQDWFAGKFDCSLEELTLSTSQIIIKGFQDFLERK